MYREGEKKVFKKGAKRPPRPMRQRNTARYQLAKDAKIDYKNIALLQKYLNERGRIVSKRISGITTKEQRLLTSAIKKARFLALLPTG